jgi:hypothetical protein
MPAAAPPGADALLPNALLVIAALDALNGPEFTCSAKTDNIGSAVGKNAAWVRRHAAAAAPAGERYWSSEHFLSLSPNGHSSVTPKGRAVARLLRAAPPAEPPRAACPHCGAARVGDVHGGRQLYACGRVMQWCPASLPGSAAPEVPARSKKAQHNGTWFRACGCGWNRPGYWNAWHDKPSERTSSSDGMELRPGAPVSANMGSAAFGSHGGRTGVVWAAANGTVLVDWDDDEAAIFAARGLLTPGAPDETGLSDYQGRLWAAIRDGGVMLEINDDATWGGKFEGRTIVPRALEVLIEHRLLEPCPNLCA